MKEYVLVHVQQENYDRRTKRVLLVEKKRPQWQNGRLNLIGGKVEENELTCQAVIREVKEESGFDVTRSKIFGTIVGDDYTVYCCVGYINSSEEPKPRKEEDEIVKWYWWESIKYNSKLIPNLFVIIPLLEMEMFGWKIIDNENSINKSSHKIELNIPIKQDFINADN